MALPSTQIVTGPASFATQMRGKGREFVDGLLPQYLPRQRWFGSKSKTIHTATVADTIPLANGAFVIALVEVSYNDGSAETYQLPLGLAGGAEAERLRESFPRAVVAAAEESSGPVVYDASVSEAFQRVLVELFASGPKDGIELTTSNALRSRSLEGVKTRVSSAEQSNTSILLGDQAILKLFRRLQPGANPEVEMTRFLTEMAHFKNIPAYFGALHSQTPPMTLAVMQAFTPNQGDGWDWYAAELQRCFSAATDVSAATLEAAHCLGVRTAQMHLGLATATDDKAFAAEEVTAESLVVEEQRIETQARKSLRALRDHLASVPPDALDQAKLLLEREDTLLQRSRFAAKSGSYGQRIRIHGDFHLGQTLRTKDDFFIVDFEGEPALPLEERRKKQSPLKDVAGMLRSFSYAAQSVLASYSASRPTSLAQWAAAWEKSVVEGFLSAYRETIRAAPGLLPGSHESESWLAALLMEKSAYELLYELNNRPAWIHIPLSGLLALTS
jgi:maltose alpha-D-glucosyltransferase/alpha-amylase